MGTQQCDNQMGLVWNLAVSISDDEFANVKEWDLSYATDAPEKNYLGNQGWWLVPATSLTLELVLDSVNQKLDGELVAKLTVLQPEKPHPSLNTGARNVGNSNDTIATVNIAEGAAPSEHHITHHTIPVTTNSDRLFLEIETPKDGGYALLSGLVLNTKSGQQIFIDENKAKMSSIRITGNNPRLEPTLSFNGPAPTIEIPEAKIGTDNNGFFFDIEDLSHVASPDFLEAVEMHLCSPVVVLEDGVAQPNPNTGLAQLAKREGGGSTHINGRMWFTTADGSSPLTNGRKYTVGLSEGRTPQSLGCKSMLWLYSGDAVNIELPKLQLDRLPSAIEEITIVALATEPPLPEQEMRISVTVNGAEILNQPIPIAALTQEPLTIPLTQPFSGAIDSLSISLTTSPQAPMIAVSNIFISERSLTTQKGRIESNAKSVALEVND